LVYSIPSTIKVGSVICRSQYGACNAEILKRLELLEGKSIKAAKSEINNTFSKDLSIEKFLIRYVLPNDLKVEIVERKGMYAIRKSDSQEIFVVNEEGKIILTNDSSSLPQLLYTQGEFNQGDQVNEEFMFALKILFDMNYLYKVKEAKLDASGVLLSLEDGIDVTFPLSGDKDAVVGGLVLIYSQLKGAGENTRMKDVQKPITIDMRYRNPVIREGTLK